MKKTFYLILALFIWFSSSGQTCTKEIVYGKDYYTQPSRAYYVTDKASVMTAVQKALENLGYEIQNVDQEKGRFTTGWQPVEGDSHYFDLFGRKDYGVSDGAYYQLTVDLAQEGSQIKVTIGTTVKTLVGKLETSGKLERKIITQLDNYLRAPQIEMSNVGVRKK